MRAILILLVALAAGGCSSLADGAIAMVGGPERGFMTPTILTDDGAPVRAISLNGCTPAGCPQAPGYCAARRYQPGTEVYRRCILSVEQNLRRASFVTRAR